MLQLRKADRLSKKYLFTKTFVLFFIMRWFAESPLTIGAAGDGVLFAVIQRVFSKSNVIKISKPYLMHTLNFEMLLSWKSHLSCGYDSAQRLVPRRNEKLKCTYWLVIV